MSAFYTQLFVAPLTEAETIAIDQNEDANEKFPNVCLDRVGDLELVELWDVIDPETNAGTLYGGFSI